MTSTKSTQKRAVRGLSPGCCTTFAVMFICLVAIWASTSQGADPCLRGCTDFFSGVCTGTRIGFPMHWRFNNKVISRENEEYFNIELSRGHDDDGYWIQNITAYVCEPVYISCREGEKELLSHNISYCEDNEIENNFSTWTTNTTSDPGPQPQVNIAAAVLVPTCSFIIIVAVVVVVPLLIWFMKRPRCPGLTVNVQGDSDNLDDTNTPKEPSETVPAEQISDGVMTCIPRGIVRNQRKSNTSRDDALIEVKVVEEDSMSMPVFKPQVDNVNQSPNLCLPHDVITVQECSDKYALDPVFYHDGQISVVTGILSAENRATYHIPENISGQEEIA